jgi:hypothetical protein
MRSLFASLFFVDVRTVSFFVLFFEGAQHSTTLQAFHTAGKSNGPFATGACVNERNE